MLTGEYGMIQVSSVQASEHRFVFLTFQMMLSTLLQMFYRVLLIPVLKDIVLQFCATTHNRFHPRKYPITGWNSTKLQIAILKLNIFFEKNVNLLPGRSV